MSVRDFQNVLRLQRVVTLRQSIGFQSNLVHKQPTLSPTSCSQKIHDFFLSLLHIYGFSKTWQYWAVNLESLGLDNLANTKTSKPCIILFQSMV